MDAAPKALYITRKYPPSVGGMENFASDLYNSLTTVANVSLLKWGGSNKYLLIVIPYFFLAASVRLILKKIDVIHIQDGLLSPLGFILSRIFNKPWVVVVHGLDITYKNKYYQTFIPKFVARANAIVCISEAAATEAKARGCPSNRIKVIPLGCDPYIELPSRTEALRILAELTGENLKDRKVIMNVGRLVKRKGIAWLVENVMPGLIKEYKDILLFIIGQGEEADKINQIIKEKNLSGHVKLLGRVENEAMNAVYAVADIFVMPNIKVNGDIEGFGIVLVEAAVRQKPIIASGIEGILEATKHNKNAIHVSSGSTEEYNMAIGALLDDAHGAQKFGKAAREYTARNFSWENIAGRYKDVYEGIIDDKKKR